MNKVFRIALAGNPNCGKTTIFNQLTGTRQHVGNYPGVTVERKIGRFQLEELSVEIVDLPGIYSLSSSSPEEKVAFQELMSPGIDLILNVVDASIPQRSLYLTTQLTELGIPMLIVFNMMDEAREKGLQFQIRKIEEYFGAEIVQTVGSRGGGMDHLRESIGKALLSEHPHTPATLHYGNAVDEAIAGLVKEIDSNPSHPCGHIPARCIAIKLLENDDSIRQMPEFEPYLPAAEQQRRHLEEKHAIESETFMADCRYGIISGICRSTVKSTPVKRQQISDQIDKVMTSKFIGLPIFFLIMLLTFWFTFTCAQPFMDLIEALFRKLTDGVNAVWPEGKLDFLRALLADGIIGGVGGVLVFLPNIVFLFLAIAFLEDSGYMARAAFVMDGFMRKFGLHGKSFIPLLLGFGCTVPAIMATRSIESEKDRMTTIMVLPLMSCGARLPIYSLIIPAFFVPRYQAWVMWLIYLIGVVIAMIGARLLKSTLFKGDGEVYIMELPPYRMPTLKSILIHMWERSAMYLRKAGTIILAASIVLFIANTYPKKESFSTDYSARIQQIELNTALSKESKEEQCIALEEQKKAEELAYTISGRVGKALEPVFRPLGFDWKISTALIGALAAKEVFVSQLGILYAVGDADETSTPLKEHLVENYTPLQGFCIMLFCLLSIPCMATIAIVRRETNSWKMAMGQAAGLLLCAYLLTFLVYQIGSALRIGTSLLS